MSITIEEIGGLRIAFWNKDGVATVWDNGRSQNLHLVIPDRIDASIRLGGENERASGNGNS